MMNKKEMKTTYDKVDIKSLKKDELIYILDKIALSINYAKRLKRVPIEDPIGQISTKE